MGWIMGPPALVSRVAALRYDMGSSPYLGRIITGRVFSGSHPLQRRARAKEPIGVLHAVAIAVQLP